MCLILTVFFFFFFIIVMMCVCVCVFDNCAEDEARQGQGGVAKMVFVFKLSFFFLK